MVMNVVDTEVERLLGAGKEAARTGDVAQARSYLTQVVERDPHNEQAWMWLSGVVAEPEEQQICLENVLVVNPYNTKARKGLEFLSVKTGVPSHSSHVPTEFTAPLTDLSVYDDMPVAPQSQAAPPPVPAADMSLPPWMQHVSTIHDDHAALSVHAPAVDFGTSPGQENGFESDAVPFAPPTAPTPPLSSHAAVLPSDPWGGINVSGNSLDIDWSKGLEPEPAPGNNGGFGAQTSQTPDVQAWPGMDMFSQQPNDPSQGQGMYNTQAQDGGMPGWSLGAGSDFDPIRAGSLGSGNGEHFGQAHNQMQAGNFSAERQEMNGYSPMGVAGDFQLPQPSDLPGYAAGTQAEAMPWYAQSPQPTGMMPQYPTGMLTGIDPNADERTQHLSSVNARPVVMVDCPNCHEQVADTALACPHCNFSFFINCPHCHELVDTIDAKTNETELCPYCSTAIEKMRLGMANADPNSPYPVQKATKMEAAVPGVQHYVNAAAARRGFSWAWVVDVMWLATVVAMVWALTQLPMWLHLTGQY